MGRGAAFPFCLKYRARIDERELCEFARANVARFKAPHSVIFVKELPKLRPTFTSSLFANLNQD
jgi:hypothetical protein